MNLKFVLGLSLFLGIVIMSTPDIFAEVTELQTNNDLFYHGDKILFKGQVEPKSSGLVTIVIRNTNDDFVLLSQAIIDEKNSFTKTVLIDDRFSENGVYRATGFILNMTAGISIEFGVSDDDLQVSLLPNTSQATVDQATVDHNNIADFVDPEKNPHHYLDRYYKESTYKSWFDRNYPHITIEEAIGFSDSKNESQERFDKFAENKIIQKAQATLMNQDESSVENNSEVAQIALAIGGLGILFGAVYGIKKKVDDNSKQISINKDLIKKKIIDPLLGSSPSNILQTRLAKGEITLEEYDELEKKLAKISK